MPMSGERHLKSIADGSVAHVAAVPEEVHLLEFDLSRVDLGIQPVIKEGTSATLSG